MGTAAGVVLSHAGGWDELLVIVLPIALFLLFRWLSSRRVQATDGEEAEDPD